MKVLYVLGNYPKISESYISAELKFMNGRDIELGVWSQRTGSPGVIPLIPPTLGTLEEAISSFKPDIIHVHYISTHDSFFSIIERSGKPVTVRGHSFDFSVDRVRILSARKYIRKIYLFPHMARICPFEKVVPLPVAFDSLLHQPSSSKDWNMVLRSGAAKHGKGLESFFHVAQLCPNFRFVLVANVIWGEESYMDFLREKTMLSKGRVTFFENMPNEESASLTRKAGIYLDTSDIDGHPFGMPVSIAESMATGGYVLALDRMGAKEYIGDAGAIYRSSAEAARIINSMTLSTKSDHEKSIDRSVLQSFKFMDTNVLPKVINDWKSM
jgi:glycosyltransferase involved in cell wall biosynthesis